MEVPRLFTGGDKAQAGRRHQALLRAGDGDIDAPVVHLEGHGRQRRDGVDHKQRAVAGIVNRFAQGGNVVDDARGGVDLDRKHGLDFARLVLAQALLERCRIDRAAPVPGQDLGLDPDHRRHLGPADGKAPAFQREDLVAP